MASYKSFMVTFGAVLLFGFTLARPANDKDTANDVHLNSVLPDKERGAVRLVESPVHDAPQVAANLPSSTKKANLELEEEHQTTESDVTVVTQRPSYFSRLIQSIFDIPISVLQSVRNLIQTTNYRSPTSSPH